MTSLARPRTWMLIAVAVAAAVIGLVHPPAWLQLLSGTAFLLVVVCSAASSLAGAILGPDAGLELRASITAVLALMAVIVSGAIYLAFHTKLRPFELVVALAVLALLMHLGAFALRRRAPGPNLSVNRMRFPQLRAGQVALGVLAAILLVASVVVAVTSTRSADARHEFTALGIHPGGGPARPGRANFVVDVISHQTFTSRFILTITAGSQRVVRKVAVDPGKTVHQWIQVPDDAVVACTLARATRPGSVYRSVRIVPKAAKPSAGG